jgi:UDP-2,3-diacylglucosamine pyrophosphatase LpxH
MSNDKLLKVRSLFISDIHLGSSKSQANKLLDVFKKYEFDNLFIIGDFIDLTSLKRKFWWNSDHSLVIQKILRYSRKGVNVVYIIGNHDFYIRDLIVDGNIKIGDILICDEFYWTTASGKKIWMTHGDCFDGFIRLNKFLYNLGDVSYELSMKINRIYNFFRRIFGLDYWSLSAYLKRRVKNVISFLTQYKKISEIKLKEKAADILMMGHIHTPEITENYINTGDFCESNSYVVELLNGELELRFIK